MDLINNIPMFDWTMNTVQGHKGEILTVSCIYTDKITSEKHNIDLKFELAFLKELTIKFIDFIYNFLSKNFKKIFNIN